MNNRFVVLVPSRARPQAAAEMVEAFRETSTFAGTSLQFVVDRDDPTADEYPAGTLRFDSHTMVEALNGAALTLAYSADAPRFLGFLGDDHRPRTRGWDRAYVRTLAEMGSGLVYCDDGYMGVRLPTQVAMTTDIVFALGYMAPPTLTHLYVDNFWLALGKLMGRIKYLPNVLIEHMHPVAGKAEWTEGHKRVNQQSMFDKDRRAYQKLDMVAIANAVRDAL